ncbi:MAG: VPS10 domain-containing protein [Pyrinomonadaceae bacterium]
MKRYLTKSFSLFSLLAALLIGPILPVIASDNLFIDPDNFADWAVVGPDGGDVRAIAVDPKDKDHLIITTFDGQLHYSNDAGKTWRLLVNLNQPQLVLDQLIIDSRDSKRIYTSGHRGKKPGGFFHSTDGGATWKEAKDLRNEAIHAMTQATDDPNILFAGSDTGVWVSKNSGDDWEKISSSSMPRDINSLEIDPRSSATIYAGTSWRPYKSTDSGKSWRLIKAGMIDDSDIFSITVNSRDQDHIFASACSGIYESLNGGEQWKKVNGIPSTSRRTRALVQHPSKQGTILAGTTEGFWMSNTGGKSWMLTTQRNLEINSIAVHPDVPDRIFIATNNFGVMVSNDGGRNFTQSNLSFTSRLTYSVSADRSQPNRLYATTQNTSSSGGFVFYSDNSGKSWTQSRGLDVNKITPFTMLQDRTDQNTIYLGTNVGLYKSVDRGVSWSPVTAPKPAPVKKAVRGRRTSVKRPLKGKPLPKPPVAKVEAAVPSAPKLIPAITEKVRVMAFTEDGKDGIFVGTDNGLYRTYDLTKGWEKLEFGDGLNANVFVVHASPLVPGTIWVGTATSGVIVSEDDGKTWKRIASLTDTAPISSIAIDPKRPNYIFVGTAQTFYLSRDGGRSWDRKGSGLPYGDYSSIIINPDNTDEVFAASSLESDGGLYFSENAGGKWKRIDGKGLKIPSHRVRSIVFDPLDHNRIYAGSHSSGVYVIERKLETAENKTAESK